MAIDSHDRRAFLKASLGGATALSLASELRLAAAFRPQSSVRVALIGCGRQGRAMLTELAKIENVTVVAMCDPVESRLSSGLRRAKGAEGYATFDELLAAHTDMDAVFVATPTHLHREPAVRALEAGLHVYCEAPLAHTLDDARAITAAAKASTATFQCGMLGRLNPIYGLANKFHRSGSIGDIAAMRAQWHNKNSWRVPARNPEDQAALDWKLDENVSLGLAGEVGVHQFDVINWFTDRYPVSVRGSGSIRLHNDGRMVHDTIQCELDYGDGLRLLYEATLANSFDGEYELLQGTMGSFKLAWTAGWMFKEADAPTQGWEVYANRQTIANEQGITLIADATKLAAQDKLKDGVGLPDPPLWYGLSAFLKCATEGETVAVDASEGARALAVALAVKQSIDTGGEVVALDADELAAL